MEEIHSSSPHRKPHRARDVHICLLFLNIISLVWYELGLTVTSWRFHAYYFKFQPQFICSVFTCCLETLDQHRKMGPYLLSGPVFASISATVKLQQRPLQLVSIRFNSADYILLLLASPSENILTPAEKSEENRGGAWVKTEKRTGPAQRKAKQVLVGLDGGRMREGAEEKKEEREEGKKSRVWSSGLFSTEACDTGPLNKCSVCCSALQRNW